MRRPARSANPDRPGRCGGRGTFTEDEAKTKAGSDTIRGFEDAGEMHVREAKAVTMTPLHEAIHRYQHPAFDELPSAIVEGTTEYFTVRVGGEQKPPLERSPNDETYFGEYNVIRTMITNGRIPERVLCEAYFRGDVDALRAAVDRDDPGRWARLVLAMSPSPPDYAHALLLFSPR